MAEPGGSSSCAHVLTHTTHTHTLVFERVLLLLRVQPGTHDRRVAATVGVGVEVGVGVGVSRTRMIAM